MVARDRAIVVGAGGDVAIVRGRKRVTGQRLEVHDIEDLIRRSWPGWDAGELLRKRWRVFRHGPREKHGQSCKAPEHVASTQ